MNTDGKVLHPVTGTPQGEIISPILANVYLHYALDVWFYEVVKAHCKGKATLCRYADDWVCAFELESDAQRFYEALSKRLAKFGLEVAAEKTNILRFDRTSKQRFEFLGFEFYRGKGRWGRIVLKRCTSRKKYKAALASFTAWCKGHCRLPKPELDILMLRIARIVFPDLPHHITQRGNCRENVFFTDDDRYQYLAWLKDYCQQHQVRVLAYRLMSNHIHFIAIPTQTDSL